MSKKLYEEESIRNIANAIRSKGVSGSWKVGEMPEAIAQIQGGGGDVTVRPLSTQFNGRYQEEGVAYSPVDINVKDSLSIKGRHCNSEGKFVYPTDEWSVEYNGVTYDNNVELIPIGDDEEVVYLLYQSGSTNDFVRFRAATSSGNIKVEVGFCKDGIFTSIESPTTFSSGGYFVRWLEDSQYRTIVFKVTCVTATAHITYVTPYAWAATTDHPAAMSSTQNSVLIRYGRLPWVTSVAYASYVIEVDNVRDLMQGRNAYSISCSSMYGTCVSLQKWRCDGWNIGNQNVTSFASMFAACYLLSDVPEVVDMTNWVKSVTTSTASMFANAYSFNSRLIVKNWDLSGLTTMASMFSNARSITYLDGIETWTGGLKITNISSLFGSMYSLSNDVIDLRGVTFGAGKLTTVASAFYYLMKVKKIYLPDMDLTNVTTAASMFQYCASLDEIVHGTITPPLATKLTTVVSMFNNCSSLKGTDFLVGWDLTNAITYSLFAYCWSIISSDDVHVNEFTPSKLAYASSSSNNNPFYYCCNMRYVDESWFDISLDTASTNYTLTYMLNYLYNVVDFYPPINIDKVGGNFSIVSYRISKESLVRLANALPTTSTKRTITMGAVNQAKLTDEEKAIFTSKGYTLA